jgi:hypothetical protein
VTAGPAAAGQIGVDPDAPRPEVGFRVHVPDDWLTLDLDPDRAAEWVERVLDERIAEHPEAARHRGHMRRILQSLIDQQRAAGVFVSAILAAGSRPADMIGANLSLSWTRLTSPPDDIGWLARHFADDELLDGELPELRTVEVVDLPAGPAVRVRTSLLAAVPESSRRQRVAVNQIIVPVPGAPWLGVLVVSTPNLSLAEVFARLADDVASSLRFLDPAGQPIGDPGGQPIGDPGGEPIGDPADTPTPADRSRPTPTGRIGYLPSSDPLR